MATNGYLSAAQLAAKEKKEEEEFRESIKPPILIDDSSDEVEVQDDNFFKAANDEGNLQIYGGGNIVVSGSGDTWVISDALSDEVFDPEVENVSGGPNLCWTPAFIDDESGWTLTISKGYIINVSNASVIEVENVTEFTPATGHRYYCRLIVDFNGNPISADVVQETNPVTIPYGLEDETNGVYYYRLFEIAGDGTDDEPWRAERLLHSAIVWYDKLESSVDSVYQDPLSSDPDDVVDGAHTIATHISGSGVIKPIAETVTTLHLSQGVLTYFSEENGADGLQGTPTEIPLPVSSVVNTLDDAVAADVNRVATHISGGGVPKDVYETVTKMVESSVGSDTVYTYTNEAGDETAIVVPPSGGGGSLPAGYVETPIDICVAGVVTSGKILFKAD
jgi:hypothetical protein